MQVRTLLAAALLTVSALGAAQAADDSTTNAAGVTRYGTTSQRTREAVLAETRNAQAAGLLRGVGEFAEAPAVATVPAGPGLSRAQVRAEVAQARAAHQLVRNGELL